MNGPKDNLVVLNASYRCSNIMRMLYACFLIWGIWIAMQPFHQVSKVKLNIENNFWTWSFSLSDST